MMSGNTRNAMEEIFTPEVLGEAGDIPQGNDRNALEFLAGAFSADIAATGDDDNALEIIIAAYEAD
jgi:hypothetical protein